MIKNIVSLLLVLIMFSSCKTIQGLTNDYDKLTESQTSKIVKLESFDQTHIGYIYEVTADQLKSELQKNQKSLVYVFTNGCSNVSCRPLKVYEQFARNNDYKLYMVMNGYRTLNETLDQTISTPLYAINSAYYGTKYRWRYSRFFENEISGKPMNEKEGEFLGGLYFFKGDKLEKILKDLPN